MDCHADTCVGNGGSCIDPGGCCPGFICLQKACNSILQDAYNDLLAIYNNAGSVIPSNRLTTLRNIGFNFLNALGYSAAPTYAVSLAEIAALGSITLADLTNAFTISASEMVLPASVTTIHDFRIGDFTSFVDILIAVVNDNPGITFSNIRGFATGTLADIKVADVAKIIKSFITTCQDFDDLGFTDAASFGDGGQSVTLDNIVSLGGIAGLGNIGSLDLDRIRRLFSRLAIGTNSLRGTGCSSNTDCCPGGVGDDCCCVRVGDGNGPGSCCKDIVASTDFSGLFGGDVNTICSDACPSFAPPCRFSGKSCHRGGECCSGRCCNGNGNGRGHCNDDFCLTKDNCGCAKKAK